MRWRADPRGDRFVALRTFRRDGSPADTPVWFAADGDRMVGFTPERSGKVARIRRDGRVETAPCDGEGEVRGDWTPGRARILGADERSDVIRLLTRRYGLAFRVFRVVVLLARRGAGVGFEVRP